MGRKSILHIRDSSGIFGSERVILTLAKNMNRDMFDLSLLCLNRHDGKSDPLMSAAGRLGIPVIPVDVAGRVDLAAVMRIRDIIVSRHISLVHSHDFKSNFYGLLGTINLGVARVATAHGSTRDSLLKRLYLLFDEWVVYRFFDRIIAVSHKLSPELARKRFGEGKVVVIQNGLDFDLADQQEYTGELPLPISRGKTVFAVIGRLFPDKGHAYFLYAFQQVHQRCPDTTALIIGDGPDRSRIEEMVRQLGIGDAVHLCGVRRDMGYVYRNIDCLVIPSLTEGLPYVLLEAMAAGIPVISTSVGDIPLLVHDGETGYLVPSGDASALAGRMQDIIGQPECSREMALKGQTLVKESYSADRMVRQTEDLYQTLLS